MEVIPLGGRAKFALYYLLVIGSILGLSIFAPELSAPIWELGYLRVCVIMGVGLGIDVAIITLTLSARFDSWEKRLLWCMRVAAWHTLLPMFGLVLCLFFANSGVGLNYSLGGAGLLLLIYLYYTYFNREQESFELNDYRTLVRELTLVASVSLDSALIGPTLIAEAKAWSDLQVCISYIVAGLVVGLVGSFSAFLGSLVSKNKHESFIAYGRYLEHLIVSYFGWSALLNYGLGVKVSGPIMFVVVFSLSAMLFALYPQSSKKVITD